MRKKNALAAAFIAMLCLSACGQTETAKEIPATATDSVPSIDAKQTDYEGFKYLYKERFITPSQRKEGEKIEGKEVILYVPESGTNDLGRSDYMCSRLGVVFEASLNRQDMFDVDSTPEETLELYMRDKYDPDNYYSRAYIRELKIEDAAASEDGKTTVCRASFFEEEDYTKNYHYKEETAAIHQMDDGTPIWISVTVDAAQTKKKTPELIKEINAYYGDIVQWDAEDAKKKQAEYEDSLDDGRFHTGYMSFELPEDWEELYGMYMDSYMYAPYDEYGMENILSIDSVSGSVSPLKVQDAIANETLADDVIIELMEIGDEAPENLTCSYAQGVLGKGARITLTGQDESGYENITAYIVVGEDKKIYRMMSFVSDGDSSRQNMADEALDMMFRTAELEDL